ncbi:MAG: VWA domain-containing protein [Methylocystis sp.]
MKKSLLSALRALRPTIRRFADERNGAVAILMGLTVPVFAGLLGLVVQEALAYRTRQALQNSTALAALAAAQDLPNSTAASTAQKYGSAAGGLNILNGFTVSSTAQLKCLTSTGVPCAPPTNANAILVTQSTQAPLIFGGLFGKTTTTISASALAGAGGGSRSGGGGAGLDIMLVLDTTASMNSSDAACSISGATRLGCALGGARTLVQSFDPSVVHVGLMVFPGITSSTVSNDYDCSTSTPTIVKYNASPAPVYQIIPFSSDYKTSATSSLNTSSNLVRALQGGGSGCAQGLSAVGGVGTYYADAINAAQNALLSTSAPARPYAQKAIILLSDGDAGATSSNVGTSKYPSQCHQGITAAQTATRQGITVYTAAYGAPTGATPSSCSTDTASPISACSAMQQMASKPSTFFSVGTAGSCTSTVNGVTSDLVKIFTQISTSLTTPRLLSLNTQ